MGKRLTCVPITHNAAYTKWLLPLDTVLHNTPLPAAEPIACESEELSMDYVATTNLYEAALYLFSGCTLEAIQCLPAPTG